MFKKTNHKKDSGSGWKVVEMQNLGYEEKQKTGVVNFVPLAGIDAVSALKVRPAKNDILPVTFEELENGDFHTMFTFFRYEGMWLKPEDSTKREKRVVRWVDTGVKKGEDGSEIGDPGYALGLDLPAKNRMNTPCFDGAQNIGKPMQFPDSDAHVVLWRIPVLWNVELQPNGDVVDGSGTPAMLELKESQYQELAALYAKLTKKKTVHTTEATTADGDDVEVSQAFLGTGYVIQIDKDTTKREADRKSPGDFYRWSKLDGVALNSHIMPFFNEARERAKSYHEYVMENFRFYQHLIDEWGEGKLDAEVAEMYVMAEIQQRLLERWGETYENSPEGINAAFNEVVPKYSVAKGSGFTSSILSTSTIDVSDDKEDLF